MLVLSMRRRKFWEKVQVIVDRFHVFKLCRKGLDALRKKGWHLGKVLSKDSIKARKRDVAFGVKAGRFNIKDQETLDKLFKYSPILQQTIS
ncbi:MAG: transposase [Candidatus Competibacteraceae bacterium]|nr:transposase [Candidatus Competibacteraceae bacterium]